MMKTLLKELIQAESTPEKGELAAAEVLSASDRSIQIGTWSFTEPYLQREMAIESPSRSREGRTR